MLGKIKAFIGEVRVELSKASWPWDPKEKGYKKYKELADNTLVVLIAVLLLSGYISGWDIVLNRLVGALVNH